MSTFASRDGTNLHEMDWPAASPRAQVAIVHGYGEHIARYDQVGKALAARGFSVHGIDLRGHGQSAGARGHVERFDEYLDDISALLTRCRELAAGRPLFLLGHSMGALAATELLLRRPGEAKLAGLILSSPYYGLKLKVSPIKIAAGRVFSHLVPKLALPTGVKGQDVTRDPELARIYDSDPLNNKNATARWFTEATLAQEHAAAHAAELALPLLMIQGADDRVADPEVSRALYEKFSSTDKTLSWLEGQYHEVFNELPDLRKKTLDALCDWLEARVSSLPKENVARP